jgi:hypothetical protein
VSVLDAATGETLRVLEGSGETEEIIHSQGMVLAAKTSESAPAKPAPAQSRAKGKKKPVQVLRATGGDILAFDARTGKPLWTRKQAGGGVLPQTLAAAGELVFFQGSTELVCLNEGRPVHDLPGPAGEVLSVGVERGTPVPHQSRHHPTEVISVTPAELAFRAPGWLQLDRLSEFGEVGVEAVCVAQGFGE